MKSNCIKVAIGQLAVNPDKAVNINKGRDMIQRAAKENCQIVVLPEMFNCPYEAELFSQYAERYPEGETYRMLKQTAAAEKIVVVGGSVPEQDEKGKLYNTSFIFDEKGNLLGRHRKMHLFDVEIEDGTSFKESSILSAGQEMTVLNAAGLTLGIGICYDIRFPELSRLMTLAGAQLLIFPGAFGMTTGPAHWELLMRSRAIDNQVFIIGAAPGKQEGASYEVYGHSVIVDPWGSIVAMAGYEEALLIAEINLDSINKVREELPLLKHLRSDLYEICKR